jgi:hypothetical protein
MKRDDPTQQAATPLEPGTATPAPPTPIKTWLYLANLVALVVVCMAAAGFFKIHLEPYFDQVALVGGTVSVWALLKIGWTAFEKSSKTDAWDLSRRLISSSELSRVLLALIAVLAALWFTTGSQYFEYDGPGASDSSFTVHVLKDDTSNHTLPIAARQSFAADAVLTPNARRQGRGFFWRFNAEPLLCVLEKKGVPYQARDCSIHPGSSTRTKVPGDFRLKKMHLIRIIPSISAFMMLPSAEAEKQSTFYRLLLKSGQQEQRVDDLRRSVLLLGGKNDEMDELRAMQSEDELKSTIRGALLAKGIQAASAEQTIAILTRNQQTRSLRLEEGQTLSLSLELVTLDGGRESATPVPGYPRSVAITSEKVQTIWLQEN